MLKHGTTPILDLRTEGAKIQLLLNSGHVVWSRASNIPGLPSIMGTRITSQDMGNGAEKWFEVGIPVANTDDWTGNASAGWTTLHGMFGLVLWWSEDLVHWAVGKYTSVGTTSDTIDGEACTVYWCRSMYPNDSAITTAALVLQSGGSDYAGDIRNNPLTALTINGVVQSSGFSFPYTMPDDAARLQADLRSAGFASAAVSATSDIVWTIAIPGVAQSSYNALNKIFWPSYLVSDMFGTLNTPVDGRFFGAGSVNAAGVRTKLVHQFAKLQITSLKL